MFSSVVLNADPLANTTLTPSCKLNANGFTLRLTVLTIACMAWADRLDYRSFPPHSVHHRQDSGDFRDAQHRFCTSLPLPEQNSWSNSLHISRDADQEQYPSSRFFGADLDDAPGGELMTLLCTPILSACLGCLGVTVAVLTGSRAILLDGMFRLVYLVVGVFSIRVAQLIARPHDDVHPFGYASPVQWHASLTSTGNHAERKPVPYP